MLSQLAASALVNVAVEIASCDAWHTASVAGKCKVSVFNLLCCFFSSLLLNRAEKLQIL